MKICFYVVIVLFICCINNTITINPDIVTVICSYNNEKYCIKNLISVVNQTYKNNKIIYINDNSTDKTYLLVKGFIKKYNLQNKLTLVNNKERKGALANMYNAISSIDGNKIVALVDGDDWLANNKVLERIAKEYQDENIWLTYGQYLIYPANIIGSSRNFPISIAVNNLFRKYPFVTSHLKTFKASLFHKIKKESLMIKGKFFDVASDVAFMIPMLEMAGKNHIKFIPDILYIYNYANPINDDKLKRKHLEKIEKIIRLRSPYDRILSLN